MAPPVFVHLTQQSSARHLQESAHFTFQMEAMTVLKGHNLQVFRGFHVSFLLVFETSRSGRAEKGYQNTNSTCWYKVGDFYLYFIFISNCKLFQMGC